MSGPKVVSMLSVDARNQLLLSLLPSIRFHARRLAKSPGDVDDLEQEFALKVIRRSGNYCPSRGRPSTWFKGVAKSTASLFYARVLQGTPIDDDMRDELVHSCSIHDDGHSEIADACQTIRSKRTDDFDRVAAVEVYGDDLSSVYEGSHLHLRQKHYQAKCRLRVVAIRAGIDGNFSVRNGATS